MKKIIAILLAVIMLSIPVATFAHSKNNNQGEVPKTETAPTLDAVKDDVYNEGLRVSVKNPHSSTTPGALGGGGDAWYLWDDSYLYVFMSFNLANGTNLSNPADYDTKWKSAAWELTNIEFHIDFSNAGENNELLKFRVVDKGYQDSWVAKSTTLYGEESHSQYTSASAIKGNTWNVEWKISFAGCKAALDGAGVAFGGDAKEGKQIGVLIFEQEVSATDGSALYFDVPTERALPNLPIHLDYVVLGSTVVGVPETIILEDFQAPATEPEASVTESPAPTPAPVAPQTSDIAFIGLLGFIISCLGFALVKFKKEF